MYFDRLHIHYNYHNSHAAVIHCNYYILLGQKTTTKQHLATFNAIWCLVTEKSSPFFVRRQQTEEFAEHTHLSKDDFFKECFLHAENNVFV